MLKHWFRSQLTNEALLGAALRDGAGDAGRGPGGRLVPEHLDLDGDRSACELSSVFGRGVMDLGAATAPVGQTSIALGGRVAEGGAPARASGIVSGRAMGDALGRALAGRKIALFDTLGAPFWIDAARLAADPAPPGPAARLSGWLAVKDGTGTAPSIPPRGPPVLAILAGPAENGLALDSGGLEGAHLGLVSQPAAAGMRLGNTVLSAFASTVPGGDAGAHALDADTHGVALSWSPADGRTGLRAGLIRETDTLFGADAEGAFGTLSSGLSWVGASGAFEAGGWRVGLAGEGRPCDAGGLGRHAGERRRERLQHGVLGGGRAPAGGRDAAAPAGAAAAGRERAPGICRFPWAARRRARWCASGSPSTWSRRAVRSMPAWTGPARSRPGRSCGSAPG